MLDTLKQTTEIFEWPDNDGTQCRYCSEVSSHRCVNDSGEVFFVCSEHFKEEPLNIVPKGRHLFTEKDGAVNVVESGKPDWRQKIKALFS